MTVSSDFNDLEFISNGATMEQKALVTGATAGIGWEIAKALARRHYTVFITGRRTERLEQLAQEIRKEGKGAAVPMAFDVSNKDECKNAVASLHNEIKGLSVVVNNAGLAKGTDPVNQARISDWETMVQTNVMGLMYMTRLLVPYLETNGRGDIINIGSVAGRWVYPGGAVYCATKHAVRAFSEGLRWDLRGKNIRVMNIEPGRVRTEFSLVRFDGDKTKADRVYMQGTPLEAKDIAQSVVWCIERPPHVNVQELVIYPTDQAGVIEPLV